MCVRFLPNQPFTVAASVAMKLPRELTVEFHIIDQPGIDMCLGVKKLAALGAWVDAKSGLLPSENTQEVLAVAVPDEGTETHTSLVTSVSESVSDEKLVDRARLLMKGKSPNLPLEKFEELWQVFLEYKECWLRPRPGRCKTQPAAFQVEGRPTRGRIRPHHRN
eukprot:GHVN01033397.1.p1 GENE.GHVN01033397.1~~GHVN01033397.1.p1  ORF type:complete len:171 (+),score=6.97 GHVN01033397.1:22-513(+)